MAVIQPKKRGRPAGTRAKHAPTVESVRDEWAKRCQKVVAECDAKLKSMYDQVRNYTDLQVHNTNLQNQLEKYRGMGYHMESLEKKVEAQKIRETKLFGIIEYLEDKVKQLLEKTN